MVYAESDSYIKIKFADEVLPLITMLEKHFTSYELQQVASLKSVHAIRMYELLIQYRTVGKLEISLSDLRLKLGIADGKYPTMNNFKARVLDVGIQQINEHSDISVNYEQVKTGRQIAGLKFSCKQKAKATTAHQNERDGTTIDFLTDNLTDKQLERIARNKLFIADYNHMITPQSNANNDMNEWVKVMVTKMKTNIKQFNKKPLNDYLK